MKDFGSASRPLRPSQLPYLVLCTWRAVAREKDMIRSESGKSADTGSAVHLAIASFHQGNKETDALAAMRHASATFPLADLHEAERIFCRYAGDPRHGNVVAVEQKIEARLSPKYVEGLEIVIQGTADQIRWNEETRQHEVWDVKTGVREGLYFQTVYAVQLAAYVLGARAKFSPVVAGGYIRTKGYFTRGAALPSPDGVLIPANIPDPDRLLDSVRWAVCAIREGYIVANPGEHCSSCPFQGTENCLPKLTEYALAL